MKKTVLIMMCAFTGIGAFAAQLLHNPAFRNPKPVAESSVQAWAKYGIEFEGKTLPFGWTMSSNSIKVSNGKVRTAVNKDRLSLHMSSTFGEIICYSFLRIKLADMGDKAWAWDMGLHGTGTVTPVAYGYNAAGKCVYFKRFGSVKLDKKTFPQAVAFSKKDFEEKGAVEVTLGIAVKGRGDIYGMEFKDVR